jgi:hypothetical protein
MALGGSGTSSDPYIVHDWSELLEAFDGVSENYIELANDIEAPEGNVTVSTTNTHTLDGKGYAINNLCHSGTDSAAITLATPSGQQVERWIKNISFTNLYLTGGYAIDINPNNGADIVKNVGFSGRVDNAALIRAAYQNSPRINADVQKIAANIETSTGNCKILVNRYSGNNDKNTIYYGNIRVKYLNCSPQVALTDWSWDNTLFDITAENANIAVNLGNNINNCCVIGKGSGVGYTTASGKNIVENALPVTTIAGVVYSLTTAQMKDAQYLHDTVGFPIGVE